MIMDYKEALKKIGEKKHKENFLVIELDYSNKIVLPYKEGIAFMGSLANAENLSDRYGQNKSIGPLGMDSIKTYILSAMEYEQIKIAALLNVTLDEVKQFALEAA